MGVLICGSSIWASCSRESRRLLCQQPVLLGQLLQLRGVRHRDCFGSGRRRRRGCRTLSLSFSHGQLAGQPRTVGLQPDGQGGHGEQRGHQETGAGGTGTPGDPGEKPELHGGASGILGRDGTDGGAEVVSPADALAALGALQEMALEGLLVFGGQAAGYVQLGDVCSSIRRWSMAHSRGVPWWACLSYRSL